ncbi:MAG: hypothetical protein JNK82_04310 [Myxococcaceae bacterium]|nr:hypothetical protein [Myxococcaceae bacterium]
MTCEHCGVRLDVGALVCPDCGREQGRAAAPAPAVAETEVVAHAQPCEQHPDLPVAGTCPRCGVFVCIRCAPKAASGGLTCSACLERGYAQYAPKPSPFGGPLVIPMLGVGLRTCLLVAVVAGLLKHEALHVPDALVEGVALVMMGLQLALGLVAFAGFFRRRRWLPLVMVVGYALAVAQAVLTWRLVALVWVPWSLGWAAYFLTSKRVKATFTEG